MTLNLDFEEGFQKGKLEQKKEELEFLIELRDNDIKFNGSNQIYSRIKQLQKEIGEEKGK